MYLSSKTKSVIKEREHLDDMTRKYHLNGLDDER